MRFLRLKVEHFRCIRKSQLEFGAGLNVLHGPNDLGKSSLAAAIRAVLLMQVTSTGAQDFECWHGGGDAHVELTFETGPQRIWRVEKRFGNRPHAYLYESRDGVDFHKEADGRAVDGQLNEILRWGLAAPGGKGRRASMPVTFLSSAFLAEQDQVSAIFKQALSGDSEESGKKRLIEVLQAVAEDPMFKSVLQLVQVKVAEAFSASGQRKRGKDSPWVKIQEQVGRAEEEQRQCSEQLDRTIAIESELKQLLNQQIGIDESLQRCSDELAAAQEDYDRAGARHVVLVRLGESKRRLDEITTALEKLASRNHRRHELQQSVFTLVEAEESAKAKLTASAGVSAQMTEELRAKTSDQERERGLSRNTLERNVADLRARRVANEGEIAQVRSFEALMERTRILEFETLELTETIAAQTLRQEQAVQALRELDSIEQVIRRDLASAAIREADSGLLQVDEWRRQAESHRTAALDLEKSLTVASLPEPAEIAVLKRLETQLQVARAKLGVGLQVVLKPKRELSIAASSDGAAPVRRVVAQEWRTDARSEIRLEIEDVAEISFSGGAESARAEAAGLQQQWNAQAEPVLNRTGLSSVDDVAEAARAYATKLQRANQLRADASALEQRIRDQRDWPSIRAQGQRELDTANQVLQQCDMGIFLVKDAPVNEAGLNQIRLKRPKLVANERSEESALTTAKTRYVEKQKAASSAKAELDAARSLIRDYSKSLLLELRDKQNELATALRSAETELNAISGVEDARLIELRRALEVARQNHIGIETSHSQVTGRLQRARGELASVEGELKILEETTVLLDEGSARSEVATVEAELALLPGPISEVGEELLKQLRGAMNSIHDQLVDVKSSIQAKRGALEQVGGQVAKERMESALETLTQLKEKERSEETNYAAWQLLRDTLLEAEQQEGVHLGRLLGGPIVQRFSELTTGRYGKFTLGPDLETNTITAAGEGRSVEMLSVGTRDQLSIIFRLTLAEQLQSAVVLDDQLTQSDGQRMSWISDLIRQMAKSIQIVVFTCRPGDYLTAGELKGGRKADGFSPWLRGVDLTQVIERSRSGG